jgi:hypothetical protein
MEYRRHPNSRARSVLLGFATALMGSTAFVSFAHAAKQLPTCSGLAAQLLPEKGIVSATSAIQPANGTHKPYCLVNITVSDLAGPKDGYLPGQRQMINIGIGLPLSASDGGTGGILGAWNERIQDLGGGGFAGSVGSVTGATDSGFAGSSTDTGHPASAGGTFSLNPDNTLNLGLIRDFAFNGIHEQAVWSKTLVKTYYGKAQKYTYWNGCSTGGRQGHQQAQKYPNDYDGILAGANAINWDRLNPAQLWPQVVMNTEVGGPIALAKLHAVTQAAITACDGLDGIFDGVIQDPRACHYSAKSFVCTGSPNDPANCLTAAEAGAVDKIWDGEVKNNGGEIWFGPERGTPLDSLAGTAPLIFPFQWFPFWVEQNPSFDWHTFTEPSFFKATNESELKFHDVIGTDDPDLSAFSSAGGKMITYHGLADNLIPSRGTYNYYNRVTDQMGGLGNTQKFYRFFPYAGNNHCGGNSNQPNAPLIDSSSTSPLFAALINWVEHGAAPDSVVAYDNANPALATVSRPICKYPDKLVYDGVGSTNVASSFACKEEKKDPLQSAEQVIPDSGASGGNNM